MATHIPRRPAADMAISHRMPMVWVSRPLRTDATGMTPS